MMIALSGCSTSGEWTGSAEPGSLAAHAGEVAGSAVAKTRSGFKEAALSPLEDLNLRRDVIPPVLASLENPYETAAHMDCDQITSSVAELDAVLGPDWDTIVKDDRLMTDRLADEASKAALGVVESGATGWIPFRGVLRKATGAETHEKEYSRAFKIGAERRAYLKGFSLAKGCQREAQTELENAAPSHVE